jgi:hypothetical protein
MTWVGVNRLPPVGLMTFSVGDAVVVVVVVLEGFPVPPLPQAVVNAPIAMIATTPLVAARRRATRCEFMASSDLSRD